MNINEFKTNIDDMKLFNNKQFLKCASSIEKLVKLNSLCFDYCYDEIMQKMELYNTRKKLLDMYESFLYICKKKKLKNIDMNTFESHPRYEELKRKEHEILCKLYPHLK